MIRHLIRWSAGNLILMAVVLAAGLGLYAITKVPLDAIPDLSDTELIICTEYSGQAPQVIEDQSHLSALDGHAVSATIRGVARVFVLRRLVRPCDL